MANYDNAALCALIAKHTKLGNSFDSFARDACKHPLTYGLDSTARPDDMDLRSRLRQHITTPKVSVYQAALQQFDESDVMSLSKKTQAGKRGLSLVEYVNCARLAKGIQPAGFKGERSVQAFTDIPELDDLL